MLILIRRYFPYFHLELHDVEHSILIMRYSMKCWGSAKNIQLHMSNLLWCIQLTVCPPSGGFRTPIFKKRHISWESRREILNGHPNILFFQIPLWKIKMSLSKVSMQVIIDQKRHLKCLIWELQSVHFFYIQVSHTFGFNWNFFWKTFGFNWNFFEKPK